MITLYEWQIDHANRLLAALINNKAAIDASDTGTGKTYAALWIAKQMKQPFLVICPKAVIPKWKELAEGLSILDVMNVEKLKRSKYLRHTGKNWFWLLKSGTLVIFDEVHQFGGIDTQNSRILAQTKIAELTVLGLSATIAYSPLRLRALGLLLGLFPDWWSFWKWTLNHGAYEDMIYTKYQGQVKRQRVIQFTPTSDRAKEGVKKIHQEIFDAKKGSRIQASKTPGFPDNHVFVDCLRFDYTSDIRKQYQEMEKLIEEDSMIQLTKTLRLRQKIELLKVPDLVEMIKRIIEECSVVIFVNFKDSLFAMEKILHDLKPSIIIGEQLIQNREAERHLFQSNETKICLCTYGAGGIGLDLHDINNRPRISLLNPTWSAVQLKQALGRIHRADSLSPAIQKLIYAADTVEADVAKQVKANLDNLTLLQDGDLL